MTWENYRKFKVRCPLITFSCDSVMLISLWLVHGCLGPTYGACDQMHPVTTWPARTRNIYCPVFTEKVGHFLCSMLFLDTSSNLRIQPSPLCTNSRAGMKKKKGAVAPPCYNNPMVKSQQPRLETHYFRQKKSDSIWDGRVNEIRHSNCSAQFISVSVFFLR